jgi:dolichyl-phosphate-mannose--protein O-mannosyl transferase
VLSVAVDRVLPAAGLQVTCGSTIKLAHSSSNARLHSHEVAYSRGSQQQSVTGFPESDNGQSYWIVHGAVVGSWLEFLQQLWCAK